MNWPEIFRIGANVGTVLGLIGLGVIAAFGYSWVRASVDASREARRLEKEEKDVAAIPPEDRARHLEPSLLRRLGMDLGNMTIDKKFELAKTELANQREDRKHDKEENAKAARFRLIIGFLIVLVAGALIIAGQVLGQPPPLPQPIAPEEEFSHIDGVTAEDPNLPKEIFGDPADTVGQPRQWMRVMEAGGAAKLKTTIDLTARRWELTHEFTKLHRDVMLHAYVRTPDKVIISAFRVTIDNGPRLIPLVRAPEGEAGLYRFSVSEIKPSDRLLVVAFLKQASYDAIPGSKKILLRSQALKANN